MFGLGTQELIIVLIIGALLFGAKRLPEIGKGLGEAIRGFKKSVNEPEEKTIAHNKPAETSPEEEKKNAE